MSIVNLVVSQIGTLIENFIIVDFLTQYFGYKAERRRDYAKSFLTWLALDIIVQGNGKFAGSTYILPFVAIAVLCLYCGKCLKGKFSNHLLCSLTPFLVIAVINTLVLQVSILLFQIDSEMLLDSQKLFWVLPTIVTKFVFYIVMQAFLVLFKKKTVYLSKSNWITVAVIVFVSILINLGLYYFSTIFVLEDFAGFILVGMSVGILVIDVYVYQTLMYISAQNRQNMEYSLSCLQNEEQTNQIRQMRKHEDTVAKIRHDIKNHLLSIQSLIEGSKYEEAGEYARKLTKRYLMDYESSIFCNNPTVNAVLATKANNCKNNDIAYCFKVLGDYSGFDGVELGIVLFNLLDNAIEASGKLKENRYIYLKMDMEKEYVTVRIKNRILGSVLDHNPDLATTKPEKEEHGIGHLSVRDVVERNDGMIEYYEEDDLFCVFVMLNCKLLSDK